MPQGRAEGEHLEESAFRENQRVTAGPGAASLKHFFQEEKVELWAEGCILHTKDLKRL